MTSTSAPPAMPRSPASAPATRPVEKPPTFGDSWKFDLVSGFLVFLIALPLCLGIAKASQFPPICGVFTAIMGGLVSGFFSNSELTIKGPAAGMIAIVAGAMTDPSWLGHEPTMTSAGYLDTYRFVLAVGVVSGVCQILLGLFRAGILTEFFPLTPVHALLASIGLIIISKTSYMMFGFTGKVMPAPIDALVQLREVIPAFHPHATIIGLSSLAILIAYPFAKKRFRILGPIPAQLIVLLLAIPLGMYFKLPETLLVSLPDKATDALVFPDFSRVLSATSFKWITLFCLVGSLESLLSAKAIDIIDPWKRRTDMNRDILGVGAANAAVAGIGGLPMISEILRSSANIQNGARTRLADAFHGLFLLLAVVVFIPVVKMIPIPALGAMLVFAGYRLASPKEFIHMWHLGKEQFFVFILTVGCIYPHGELLLVVVGMGADLLINFVNGASPATLFVPRIVATDEPHGARIAAEGSLTFTNWIPFKKRLESLRDAQVVVDLSQVRLIDHTFMDKLVQTQREFVNTGRTLSLAGLEGHHAFGHEATSGRKKALV